MKEFYLKTIFIIFIIILILFAIYMCVYKDSNKTVETSETNANKKDMLISNDLRIGIIDFDNINPILSNNKNVQDISRLIFEPLFTLTQDYKLEGVLAKECSKIAPKTYIIKLNESVAWHDGKKFDSSDVIFTINMLKKLKESSIYYYNIKNITLVQKIDEYTIKIITDIEVPYFEYNLIFPVISSKYFTEENLKSQNKSNKPVGTGMFYISDVTNNSILLKKNLNNVVAKKIKLETITLRLYKSLVNTMEAFKLEEIDIFITSNKNIDEYLKNTNYNSIKYINRNYNYIALNCNSDILSNKEVRQAICYGINKEEILKDVFDNKFKISNFPLDFGSYVYDRNNNTNLYDNDKAKNLLVENGWKYSKDGWKKRENNRNLTIELDIVVNKNNLDNVKVANNIKEQLSAIGLIINIKEANDIECIKYLNNKKYDMIVIESTYGYGPTLQKYFGKDNQASFINDEINVLLDEAKLLNEEKEIKEKYTRIVEIYNDEVPYISLYYDVSSMIYKSNLKGKIDPNSYTMFYGIEAWYREYEK